MASAAPITIKLQRKKGKKKGTGEQKKPG